MSTYSYELIRPFRNICRVLGKRTEDISVYDESSRNAWMNGEGRGESGGEAANDFGPHMPAVCEW